MVLEQVMKAAQISCQFVQPAGETPHIPLYPRMANNTHSSNPLTRGAANVSMHSLGGTTIYAVISHPPHLQIVHHAGKDNTTAVVLSSESAMGIGHDTTAVVPPGE